uniref:Uncharacterized protein n=1 Tax=Rhizophora mucronata TaxID=61149 RepID=A0A2P2NF97_RHIMU
MILTWKSSHKFMLNFGGNLRMDKEFQ